MKKRILKKRHPMCKKGSILIGVLWSLFVLGALAVAIYSYVFPQLSFAERMRDKTQAYYLARAGVKRAILEVEEKPKESYESFKSPWSNNDEVFKDVPLGDGSFSVGHYYVDKNNEEQFRYGLVDEESKININKASKEVLEQLFEIIGKADKNDAENIAASVVDWRDSDDVPEDGGAEEGYYIKLSRPYKCKNGDFRFPEELLFVKGVTQEIFNNLKDYITVYGDGFVNINTASALALQAIGMNKILAEKIVSYRRGSDGIEATEDDVVFKNLNVNSFRQSLDNAIGLTSEDSGQIRAIFAKGEIGIFSNYFMGISIGKVNEKKVSTRIVFIFSRDKVIRCWREY